MYGSSFTRETLILRDSRIAEREAAAMPFPKEETTPPVTKTYLVIYPRRVGMEEFTGSSAPPQTSACRLKSDAEFCRSLRPHVLQLDAGMQLLEHEALAL